MAWWEGDYPCIGPWEGVSCGAREGQGLTLAHFSAQLKRFVWDRGCI